MSNSTSSVVPAWLRLMLAAAACLTDPTPGAPACATALGGATAPTLELGPVLDFAGQQLRQTLKNFPAGRELFPGRETEPGGRWPAVEDTNWVSGALPAGAGLPAVGAGALPMAATLRAVPHADCCCLPVRHQTIRIQACHPCFSLQAFTRAACGRCMR